MRKTLLISVLFLLVIPFISADWYSSGDYAQDRNSWSSYYRDMGASSSRYRNSDTSEIGYFSNTSNTTYPFYLLGANLPPLADDLDDDGVIEIVGASSVYNALNVFSYDGSTMSLLDQVSVPGGVPTWYNIINTTSGLRILTYTSPNITMWSFNASDKLTMIQTLRLNDTCNLPGAYWVCGKGYNIEDTTCYYGSSTMMNWYMPETNTCGNSSALWGHLGSGSKMAMDDIDHDGYMEVGLICDADTDAYDGLCIFDTSNNSLSSPTFEFSTGNTGETGYDVMFIDVGSISFKGVAYSHIGTYAASGSYCGLDVRSHTGSALGSIGFSTAGSSSTNYMGGIIAVPLLDYSEGGTGLCMSSRSTQTLKNGTYCGTTYNYSDTSFYQHAPWTTSSMVSGTILGDGSYGILTSNGYILDTGQKTAYSYQRLSETSSSGNIILDIDNDGFLEILGQTAGRIWIADSQGGGNEPPVLYNNLSYGGYGNNYGYSTPLCVGSTITFSARDCLSETSCNYMNDNAYDKERIASDCGISPSVIDNGTFEYATPSFQCYYNSTGIYNVRLYLQDHLNPTDMTQYNSENIVINVINGTPGVTCNILDPVDPGETEPSVITGDGSEIDNAGTEFFSLLTGNNANTKLLIAIILIGGILTMVYVRTHSNIISVLAGLAMLIGCVAFGLFPIWILLLMIITSLIIIVLVWVVMKNGSQGG